MTPIARLNLSLLMEFSIQAHVGLYELYCLHVPSLQVLRKSVLYWQRHRSNSLVMAWLKYWAGGSTT